MQQGAKANYTGKQFENLIAQQLDNLDIRYVEQHPFTSIYTHTAKMDFYIADRDLAIEAKFQGVGGTVDQKIPYVMHDLESHPAERGLLILGGAHFKKRTSIYDWAKQFAAKSDKQIDVIFLEELEDYLEQTEARQAA